jgi:hypothetical protein
MAVPNIQMNMNINNGFNNDLYIVEDETPLETRSVRGKSNLENKYPYKIVGINIIPT